MPPRVYGANTSRDSHAHFGSGWREKVTYLEVLFIAIPCMSPPLSWGVCVLVAIPCMLPVHFLRSEGSPLAPLDASGYEAQLGPLMVLSTCGATIERLQRPLGLGPCFLDTDTGALDHLEGSKSAYFSQW